MNSSENYDERFRQFATELGLVLTEKSKTAGSYAPALLHDRTAYISGQIPRLNDAIVVTGRLGGNLTESEGYRAARICTFRSLAVLRDIAGGSLNNVEKILKICVYVQCEKDFDEISAVANGASDALVSVLGTAGIHARTSLGVFRLPKNAAVEVEVTAVLKGGQSN